MQRTTLFLALGLFACGATAALAAGSAASVGKPVAYPQGYRDWTHVKSMVINEGHSLYGAFGGIHHLYANDKAMAGYRSGKFPDGAVIVFDLLASVDAGNAVTEGPRKVLGVMQRDQKRFASTGGWGFEGFAGGDPAQRAVGGDAATACFSCHTQVRESSFVFSKWRE